MSVHFMSQRLNWQTPRAVYYALHKEFGFTYDPCPAAPFDYRRGGGQEVLAMFDDDHQPAVQDGLLAEWGSSNFVNPPYGKELPKWIKKAYEQWQLGKTVVLLIPSRTDTRWWHDYCMHATEIRFIKGRLKFDDQVNPAPFPSAIIVFRGNHAG